MKNFNFDSFLCYYSRLSIQGHTAESIKKHDEFVQRLWDDLTRKTSRKKSKLKDSSNFHKLSNEVIFLFEEISLRNGFSLEFYLLLFLEFCMLSAWRTQVSLGKQLPTELRTFIRSCT